MPTLALNADLVLPVSQATAWNALHDLTLLVDSLPADARLAAGDAAHSFALALPGFEGRVLLLDIERPSRLRLSFEGQGPRTGGATGQAQFRLESLGAYRTLVHVALVIQAERQVPSKIVGLDLLRARLAAFEAAVDRRHPADRPKPVTPPPKPWPQRLLDWYLGWFAGMFNGTLFPPPKPRQRRPRARR
ncbi:hypothetical protein CDN99_20915 [Roseateles aquatilis]|uniref:Carbon monoxide dehydrogenase n=1 Tax=Roseateles aquatilis TaxID=431061 RepID=A0A246J144_9BURK|nr:hypothetical protein [Roseateles aquatilis]OWQ86296.1 hypothetical protein CDN99_20915 [Roseateles aquatilis]